MFPPISKIDYYEMLYAIQTERLAYYWKEEKEKTYTLEFVQWLVEKLEKAEEKELKMITKAIEERNMVSKALNKFNPDNV